MARLHYASNEATCYFSFELFMALINNLDIQSSSGIRRESLNWRHTSGKPLVEDITWYASLSIPGSVLWLPVLHPGWFYYSSLCSNTPGTILTQCLSHCTEIALLQCLPLICQLLKIKGYIFFCEITTC